MSVFIKLFISAGGHIAPDPCRYFWCLGGYILPLNNLSKFTIPVLFIEEYAVTSKVNSGLCRVKKNKQ